MILLANWPFLLLIPVLIGLFWLTQKQRGLKFSSVMLLKRADGRRTIKHKIGKALVLTGLCLAIIALARPQAIAGNDFIPNRGIDIAMILDVSGSMRSVDFEPNRLEVARKTIDDFIAERAGDRISLIVFAGTAYTRIPLTLDHNIVRESLGEVTLDSVSEDGTAIGMAISVGLNRLKKSDAVSRVMILVTDGDNNAGVIDPLTASKLAQEMGIRVYTIGVGSDTTIIPYRSFGQTQYQTYEGGLDEALLMEIAGLTGGLYFRAMDTGALSRIFETISQLEKTDFEDDHQLQYHELAFPLIQAALILLAVGITLDRFWFVQIP